MLIVAQPGSLRCADGNEHVRPLLDLPAHEPRKAASSIEAVLEMAVPVLEDPGNFVLAAMDFLQRCRYGASRDWF